MSVTEKKQREKRNVFFAVEYLLCAVTVMGTLCQRDAITSAAFVLSFVLAVAWFVKLAVVDGCVRGMTVVFVTAVLTTASVMCSALLHECALTVPYLTEHAVFLSTVFFLFAVLNTAPNAKMGQAILVFQVFFAYVYWIAYRFFPQRASFRELHLNFSNPNLAGIWIFQSILYAAVAAVTLRSWVFKVLAALSIVLNGWLLYLTGARNCLLALALFAVLCIGIAVKQHPRFSKGFIAGVVGAPIAFVPVYLAFIRAIIRRGWLDFWIGEGKVLDSRVWVWQDRMEKLRGVWLIGNYAEGKGNAHNSHMVLLSSYGVIGLLLGMVLLYFVVAIVNRECRNQKGMVALAAFFGVVFMGVGEGALFSGGVGLFVPACGLLYVTRCVSDAVDDGKRQRSQSW